MVPAQSVLIIDDDAVNRRLAHVMFQKLGWQVATLDRGDRALVHLATSPYDLVLLDISMPGMNGEEVCRQIRADPCLREVRVIAYTAHVLLEEQQRFLAGGFDALLLKPISFRAVFSASAFVASVPTTLSESPRSTTDHWSCSFGLT